MQSKLTPELSQALDRAIDAAASDLLVEALAALQRLCDIADHDCLPEEADWRWANARRILAKYRPTLSDSDTPKS